MNEQNETAADARQAGTAAVRTTSVSNPRRTRI